MTNDDSESVSDITLTVTAETDEAVAAIREVTEAVEDLRRALDRLDETPVGVEIDVNHSRERVQAAARGVADEIRTAGDSEVR